MHGLKNRPKTLRRVANIHIIMLSQFLEEGVDGAKIARLPMNPHDLGGTY